MKATDKKYTEYQTKIKKQIAELQAALERHKVDNPHYGHIGDLAEVNEQLSDILNFLCGTEG